MARLDLMDAARALLAGVCPVPVTCSPADARRTPEAVVLSFGVPQEQVSYFDAEVTEAVRLTVICRRRRETDAMADASECRRALRHGALASANGSWRLVSLEAQEPRPYPFDESGALVWAFDCTIEIERKDC